jgi:hypothetical protein
LIGSYISDEDNSYLGIHYLLFELCWAVAYYDIAAMQGAKGKPTPPKTVL